MNSGQIDEQSTAFFPVLFFPEIGEDCPIVFHDLEPGLDDILEHGAFRRVEAFAGYDQDGFQVIAPGPGQEILRLYFRLGTGAAMEIEPLLGRGRASDRCLQRLGRSWQFLFFREDFGKGCGGNPARQGAGEAVREVVFLVLAKKNAQVLAGRQFADGLFPSLFFRAPDNGVCLPWGAVWFAHRSWQRKEGKRKVLRI